MAPQTVLIDTHQCQWVPKGSPQLILHMVDSNTVAEFIANLPWKKSTPATTQVTIVDILNSACSLPIYATGIWMEALCMNSYLAPQLNKHFGKRKSL